MGQAVGVKAHPWISSEILLRINNQIHHSICHILTAVVYPYYGEVCGVL